MPDRIPLAALRHAASLSQAALGVKLGCGQAAIHKYESGRVRLPLSAVVQLVDQLDLSDGQAVALLRWAAQVRPSRRRTPSDPGGRP